MAQLRLRADRTLVERSGALTHAEAVERVDTFPERRSLRSPHGAVPRDVPLRHTLALGDTGSGKTRSTVLAVERAFVEAPGGRVGRALVIGPKGAIGAMPECRAARRRSPRARRQSGR